VTEVELDVEVTGPAGRYGRTLAGAGPHWIGRDPECGIVLMANNVSRRHASVTLVPTGLLVADDSSNGTLIDGSLLRRGSRTISGLAVTLSIGTFRVRVSCASLRRAGLDPAKRIVLTPAPPCADPLELTPEEVARPVPKPDLASSAPQSPPPACDRRRMHRQLLEHLNLSDREQLRIDAVAMRPEVVAALRRIVAESAPISPPSCSEALVQELADEALGLGPLEKLLADPEVSEIMVVDPKTIFVERLGRLQLTGTRFTDDDSVRAIIERIVTPLGRRIDESTPLVDARLRDGSRVNAVIPPLALRGPCITIRKFSDKALTMTDLVQFGSLTAEMARFLERAVKVRKNIVISGGTGSGKTTLLNVLSSAIPVHERVITVEDAAELRLGQPHVVSLEARPPNLEGKGEYSIRDLVKNALRMRPDRIVVGECRGGEAIDMLQAMNTGHEGSLTTTHANSPREALARVETLCLMAGLDLPIRAIRQQIASSIHLVIQQARFSDGARRVTRVSEIVGIDDDGDIEINDIFEFRISRTRADGTVEGEFAPTGYLPTFIDQFIAHGLVGDGAYL